MIIELDERDWFYISDVLATHCPQVIADKFHREFEKQLNKEYKKIEDHFEWIESLSKRCGAKVE